MSARSAGALECGVISDTHGLLRPEALTALAGVDLIVHAGDIGPESILEGLRQIAPVHVVRGNNDTADWAARIPAELDLLLAGCRVQVVHDLKCWRNQAPQAPDVVIAGHSHQPQVETRQGVLYLNPGSAGPRRFRLPVTVARLYLAPGAPRAHIRPLL